MTSYEATNAIYEIINSGIISEEVETALTEVADCICEKGFDKCPAECLRYCKLDECPNVDVCHGQA